jgi:hypothetical protein
MKRRKSYNSPTEYSTLLRATLNRDCGYPDRALPIISEAQIAKAEKAFWAKRGFATPPGVTHAGIF